MDILEALDYDIANLKSELVAEPENNNLIIALDYKINEKQLDIYDLVYEASLSQNLLATMSYLANDNDIYNKFLAARLYLQLDRSDDAEHILNNIDTTLLNIDLMHQKALIMAAINLTSNDLSILYNFSEYQSSFASYIYSNNTSGRQVQNLLTMQNNTEYADRFEEVIQNPQARKTKPNSNINSKVAPFTIFPNPADKLLNIKYNGLSDNSKSFQVKILIA